MSLPRIIEERAAIYYAMCNKRRRLGINDLRPLYVTLTAYGFSCWQESNKLATARELQREIWGDEIALAGERRRVIKIEERENGYDPRFPIQM